MSDKIYNVLFLRSAKPRRSPLDHIGQTPTEG
jgi:hypothetical protein